MAISVLSILKNRSATIHSVSPHTTAFDALALMADEGVAAVLVMDNNQLRGVFSGKDYATRIALHAKDGRQTPVRDVMTTTLITVDGAASPDECMQIMTAKRFRHLPIMENNEVVGLVTLADLVRHQLAHHKFEIDQLIRYVGS